MKKKIEDERNKEYLSKDEKEDDNLKTKGFFFLFDLHQYFKDMDEEDDDYLRDDVIDGPKISFLQIPKISFLSGSLGSSRESNTTTPTKRNGHQPKVRSGKTGGGKILLSTKRCEKKKTKDVGKKRRWKGKLLINFSFFV
jgi:hypothetical protein